MSVAGFLVAALAAVSLGLAPAAYAGGCVGAPLELIVPPASTDPGIDQVLGDHYVYVHPDLPLRDELVVFLPGSCGRRPSRASGRSAYGMRTARRSRPCAIRSSRATRIATKTSDGSASTGPSTPT